MFLFYQSCMAISIHTSAREVTQHYIQVFRCNNDFNPHFRKGSDTNPFISSLLTMYFNPHFRKGSDCNWSRSVCTSFYFNPHFRKGSDCLTTSAVLFSSNFNPHFRKGSDLTPPFPPSSKLQISIHTSAREVTTLMH